MGATSSSSATASTTTSATATCATSARWRRTSTPEARVGVRRLGRSASWGQRVRRRLRPRLQRALPQPARHRHAGAARLLLRSGPAYVGWDALPHGGNEFVVGYGLDYNERYRNLRDIGTLAPHVYS